MPVAAAPRVRSAYCRKERQRPMLADQAVQSVPAIVTLPAEIDLTNQEGVYDRLDAAFASGAPVVIADFTATTFCDCSSLRGLLAVQERAASRNAQLWLAIPPGTTARRVAELIGLDRRLPVYPNLSEV